MSNVTPLDFSDLTLTEVPVSYDGREFILREASGAAATRYRNALMACATLAPDGKSTVVRNMASVEPLLISLCLFELGAPGSKEKAVSIKDIESWPNRVKKPLYETAVAISDLEEVDSLREKFHAALQRDDSPVSLKSLREWIDDLGEEYKPVQDFLKATPEEKAKNSPNDTEDGSE